METSDALRNLLEAYPSKFGFLLRDAKKFRFQVLLSEVRDDACGRSYLVRHGYRVDSEYFYPASAIKLCIAVGALQKLTYLQQTYGRAITCTTPLSLYPLCKSEEMDHMEPSNFNAEKITVSHEIRKLFLVSDNKAFNRLFDFVGHRTINQMMWDIGLNSVRIRHHLSATSLQRRNFLCKPIEIEVAGNIITLPPKRSQLFLPKTAAVEMEIGSAHVTNDGRLVMGPMDFLEKNAISLIDLQDLLVKVVRKDIELDTAPVHIAEGLRMMMVNAMAQYPSESCNPCFDGEGLPDDYCKFFLPGICRVRTKGAFRIFNKIGRAYGFTVENAYIFDIETAQSFFLSAVIYTNANEIVNDDHYEYDSVADRVMADLAEVTARAFWQVPAGFDSLSRAQDRIPSSLWHSWSHPILDITGSQEVSESESSTSNVKEEREEHSPMFNGNDQTFKEVGEIQIVANCACNLMPYNYFIDQ